jgi:lipid II:glycine glycyltransferase (peptidoglycan interpeptide bridge formation enzyme)
LLKATFTYNPTKSEKDSLVEFYNKLPKQAIEQHPLLEITDGNEKACCYFWLLENNNIVAYAKIKEKKGRMASITFAPLVVNTSYLQLTIEYIIDYYKEKRFFFISIQLPYTNEEVPVESMAQLNQAFNICYREEALNWATLLIDINKDEQQLMDSFSKHHKRAVKKGLDNNLLIKPIDNLGDCLLLADIHVKMYRNRKLTIDEKQNRLKFEALFRLFTSTDNGFMLGTYWEDKLIGGLVIAFQHNTAFYYSGATDPDYKHLPQSHLTFYESMKLAKNKGKQWFDMGGYDTNATPDKQTHHINQFKDGFGGQLLKYVPTLFVVNNPLGYTAYNTYRRLKKILEKGNK